jgi:glycine hydroxymethyltransferase
VGITLNANLIPYDTRKPLDPSGIRLGTPALTTRGFTEQDMQRIGEILVDVLKHPGDSAALDGARAQIKTLTQAHPLY